MKGVTWQGIGDSAVSDVPDPGIEDSLPGSSRVASSVTKQSVSSASSARECATSAWATGVIKAYEHFDRRETHETNRMRPCRPLEFAT